MQLSFKSANAMDNTNLLLLILILGITSIAVFASNEPQGSSLASSAFFETLENKRFKGRVVKQFYSPSLTTCSHSCLKHAWCTSSNFKTASANNDKGLCELFKNEVSVMSEDTELFEEQSGVTFSMLLKGCLMAGCLNGGSCAPDEKKQTFSCSCKTPWTGERCEIKIDAGSCEEARMIRNQKSNDGDYLLRSGQESFQAFCHMLQDDKGWTLIARFSNNDLKNWMRDDGFWWYDEQVAIGITTNASINTDMISPAFWLVSGSEIKITRSDDPSHFPLLQTTGNCLAGQTFRSKITSYGDFRNDKVWASDQCLGSCTVQYGGQYMSTDGFQHAECSGNIQSANKIGFWCDWESGDGSVMMIGGGGSACARADHGIGITESNEASFIVRQGDEYDFGYDAGTGSTPSHSYSLNLWIH